MELLDNIINMGTAADPPPLTAVLRQCILLANQLKTPLLRTWAMQELNGYSDPKTVPEYRIINAGAVGNFDRGFGMFYRERPIPSGLMKPQHRWAAETVRLTEPVSAYESLKDVQGTLSYSWQSNMVAFYQTHFIQDCVLMEAWQEIPKSAIVAILDIIRTRVLTMAIDIKNEFERSGADLNHVQPDSKEAQKIEQSVGINIYGGTNYFASGQSSVNVHNTAISVGDWSHLENVLRNAGIADIELKALSNAVNLDGDQKLKESGTVMTWIKSTAPKVLTGGVKIGATIGQAVLTEWLMQFYGLK